MDDRHKNRIAYNRIELTGKRFGKLMVICDTGRRKSKRPIWKCKCDCGREVEILSKYLLNGDTESCGCKMKGNAHNRTGYKLVSGSYWAAFKSNSKRRGIPILISAKYAYDLFERQDRKCNISGLPLVLVNSLRDERTYQTASLDRIDNTKGYEIGNVQWVHKQVNIMRNKMPVDDFVQMCRIIVDHADKYERREI